MTRIRELRRAAGISVSELADALGVTRITIYYWETGHSLPRTSLVPKIAAVLHCSIADLFETGGGNNAEAQKE